MRHAFIQVEFKQNIQNIGDDSAESLEKIADDKALGLARLEAFWNCDCGALHRALNRETAQ